MIKFENTQVVGFEPAIRGMRNPKNSWDKSDSGYVFCIDNCDGCDKQWNCAGKKYQVGSVDKELMMKLISYGSDHRKFMRFIVCYVDITAPLYWWKEFDTYRFGVEKNSCSTMHKIHSKEFELTDFSLEHLEDGAVKLVKSVINVLNAYRDFFNEQTEHKKQKHYWWQLIQLLPSSYNQKRTVMVSYEALYNMYHSRVLVPHKLDEWRVGFADWVETLPESDLITEK